MTTFNEALRKSASLKRAAAVNPELARELWLATKGEGDPAPDTYAEAAYDLAPVEYASLLSSGGTANSYALDCLWQHVDAARCADPHEQRELAREAWGRFDERAKKAGDVQYGLGFDQSLSWECTREFDTSVAGGLCSVEHVARIAGRMFQQLNKARSEQVSAAPEEIYDVELGSDIGRLLPSELFHLGEDTEVILLDAIADDRALQYAVKGTGEAGKGPLIIAEDESGSMHNTRGIWAKAAMIALVRTAWEDDRTCAIVHWSDSVRTRILRPGDHAGLLAALKYWLGGGNECQLALDNAADLVEELQKQGDKGADVVLVTDGVETMTPEHDAAIDRIEARGSRLWTVGVECPIDETACIRARAKEFIHIGGEEIDNGEIGAMKGAVI